ncbi:hypothetical protein Fot_30829 [Forsythia ovata]|uniref:Uncharacterized protein n=1 Tax=Forsythia ovata TaxID=205694 RepID=A0ABD1T3E2_9LAMI
MSEKWPEYECKIVSGAIKWLLTNFYIVEPVENSDARDDDSYINDSNYSLGEDDDLLFEQNVTTSIELDAREENTVTNETNDSDSLEIYGFLNSVQIEPYSP